MKLARKLTLALVFGVFLVLALSAYAQIRRDAMVFENDVQRDHHTMGRALAAAVMEVWRSEGAARALRLVEDANEREQQVNIRWVWLDGQADEPHRPRLAPELLVPVIRGTFTMLKPLADKQGVTIVEEGDTPDRLVHADADQLQQALTNVVVNAIQAMPSGGTIAVRVQAVRAIPPADQGGAEGDYIALSVRDEGQGMMAGVLEHVFEPFFTTKPVGEGTGLGLSVAYGIIKEHGGWIDVDSRAGSGSQFTMYLPQEKP
ncbi:sensor histidine kinase [Sorangium cellulosum]|uniref:histidine kinase n=1 Tax=Sorangium cellulosum TaxID=56 RepID=A1YBP8_SORCE|nr:Amb3 [Sorangium cellulosum]